MGLSPTTSGLTNSCEMPAFGTSTRIGSTPAARCWRFTTFIDGACTCTFELCVELVSTTGALAETVTRLSDREDAVPDAIWKEATRHFDEKELAGLLLWIATTNVFNRLNVATRQVAGSVKWD